MVFSSLEFLIIFLPIVVAGYAFVRELQPRYILGYLFLISVGFYSYWDWRFAILLGVLTFLNGALGNELKLSPSNVKLTVGVVLNLLVLVYFKYWNFFLDNLNLPEIARTSAVIPLGISFFIFQKIAYLVDCSRGKVQGTNLEYACFVWFFPQLIAGPIVHYSTLFPQFRQLSRNKIFQNLLIGLSFFAIGLVKKTVIADSLGEYSERYALDVFYGATPTLISAWCGSLYYTFQIYFDFSGYSDMAIGLGLIFGISLPINFWSPYKAASIIEFWRRWHISLSAFLKEYLYIPLGGSRQGKLRQFRNIIITMVLGGLWHGAGWNFIIWGALHGIYLMVNHMLRMLLSVKVLAWKRTIKILGQISTFGCVVFAWTFFQARSAEHGIDMALALLGANGIALPGTVLSVMGPVGDLVTIGGVQTAPIAMYGRESLMLLLLAAIITFKLPNTFQLLAMTRSQVGPSKNYEEIVEKRNLLRRGYGMILGMCLLLGILFSQQKSPFLYFNF